MGVHTHTHKYISLQVSFSTGGLWPYVPCLLSSPGRACNPAKQAPVFKQHKSYIDYF